MQLIFSLYLQSPIKLAIATCCSAGAGPSQVAAQDAQPDLDDQLFADADFSVTGNQSDVGNHIKRGQGLQRNVVNIVSPDFRFSSSRIMMSP
jgi:hypothetical protein